ncbi:MAG: NB-ARC domain-containing protein [Xenococcaceae cyanobacterium MO_188.B29]|nr:NB-ARC domain-containing protein [Xenococcaceae cyanobacterium MO_188.B29]
MASTKASRDGLIQIKRAIAQKGWTISDDRWLVEASKILEPAGNWRKSGPYAYGCSRQTWERFLRGTVIRDRSFIAFCQILGVDPDDVAESASSLREDWGEAPDVPIFHGREQELTTLQHWIIKEKCRLITVVGLAGIGKTRLVRGGIGKTDLSLQLARQVRGEFDYLIWRRLLNAPTPETILTELIEFLSENQEKHWAKTSDGLVTQLLKYLSKHRCLLILDNIESILQGGEGAGTYRTGYEGYGELFRRIGETEHQSCLLLTSRVKPKDIEEIEGIQPVRSLMLGGVDLAAGREIFQDIGCAYNTNFHGSDEDWEAIINFYNGNPLALEVAARHILRRFNGNISQFLQHNLKVFGKIRDLLDWHFERLSEAEKTVMYWLAINRESVSIAELKEDILLPWEKKHLSETLDTLEQQIPLEKSGDRVLMQSLMGETPKTALHRFTLQPVLMEYMSDRLIEQICEEINTNKLRLFNSHSLIKASAKDYVRYSQIRIILNPIIEQLISLLGLEKQNCLENRLSQILSSLKQSHPNLPSYAAGNLLNLIRYGNIDVSGYDFSHLVIWQANLQGIELHRVNFTACEFTKSSFTQDFGAVHSLAFSPDGKVLAIGDSYGYIRLFRIQDEQPYLLLRGHGKNLRVTSVAFSPDGKLLASSSMDKTVKLWDIHAGYCLKTLVSSQKWLWTVAFSPDGQMVASGGSDNIISIWNIDTGDCQVLEGHGALIESVAFHPDGNILASGGRNNTIRLWNIETGECCQILSGHKNVVYSNTFSPDGKTLASGSADNTIKLWDVDTGECLNTLKGHTKQVKSTAFNADGQIIASGSFDHTIKLWETQTGKLLKTLKGHITGVEDVAFDPHKNILASSDNNQMLKLWDGNTGECLKTWQGYINYFWTIAISPDGQLLASGGLDRAVRLWDIHTGKQIATLKGHHNWILSVAFSPDGQILASGSGDETIKLWNVRTGQCQNILRGHTKGVAWMIAFSPNGQLLASGGRDSSIIRFWDVGTGESLRCISAHSDWIWSVAFSPDGQYLASGSNDQTIKLWDVRTGECCLSIRDISSTVIAVAFHPNGQRLVSGGDDKQIKLWDISTGELIQTFPGHTDSIMGLVFSPEGKIIISASEDTTIRLWEIDTGQCIRVLKGHSSMVRAISLTPDGQTLVSGSADGTIRLWDFATGKTLKVLRPKRPYEGMNITDIRGLTPAQKETLIALGANQF